MFGLFTGCSSLFPVFLDELHDDADRIRGLVLRHRTDIGVAAAIQFADRKPCFSKERALRIWSPLLAFAESGMRRAGFFRARSSQIAFAPALEITTSVRANRSGSSSLIYSYWT